MSTGKPVKRPPSDFKHITTLRGLSEQDKIDFSWNEPKWFFRVTLYDRSKLCAWCKEPIESVFEATLDHIVPRSRGGRTRLVNLQLMHPKCNSSGKKGQMPSSFHPKAFTPTKSNTGTVTKYMLTKRLPQRLAETKATTEVQKNATRKEWQNHGE